MKLRHTLSTLALLLVMLLFAGIPAFAAGIDAPDEGGADFADPAGGAIHLFKQDISAFEKNMAAELIAGGQLSAGGTVTFKGNAATGAAVGPDEVVGSYTTSDAPGAEVPVLLRQLAALGGIVFRLEQVQPSAAAAPGSTNPDDYEPKAGGIDSYARTGAADGAIRWTGLPHSYYRVTEVANSTTNMVDSGRYILSLPMVDPANPGEVMNTVTLYPKNRTDWPAIEKERPTLGDLNGNILSWTVRAEIPAGLKSPQGNQSYVITDTMSGGIEYAGNMKVFYKSGGADVELKGGVDYATSAKEGDTAFTVALNAPAFDKLASAIAAGTIDTDGENRNILYLTYDTVVNLTEEELEAGLTPENEIQLDYQNDAGTGQTNKPAPVPVESYANLKVIKKDGANQDTLLPGAAFNLYTKLNDTGADVEPDSVLADSTGAPLRLVTGADGSVTYAGLGAGSYYLVEIEAPEGYQKLTGFTPVTISAADAEGRATVEVSVLNYFQSGGFTLPATGGRGTGLFLVGGAVLIALAGLVLLLGRRRSKEESRNR